MNNEIVIREYRPQDKPYIIELLRLNTPRYFSPTEEKDLLFYLANEIEQYFVVEHEGKIVGCGGFNFSEDLTEGKISWDILHPAYQGKGIGSLLLNHRIDRLKSLKHIQTISVRTSQLAYRFYEKLGFKLIEIRCDYWAKGFDLYRMDYATQ